MTGASTTKPIAVLAAGAPNSLPLGLFDESGTGAGPFDAKHVLVDPTSNALVVPASGGKQDTGNLALAAIAATLGGENHIGEIGGNSAVVTATLNRPANTTAYAVGQIVANSTIAASVAPLALAVARKTAGTGRIARLRLSSSNAGALNAIFRVHLFKTSPTSSAGDGAAFAAAVNGIAAIHIGAFDVTLDKSFSDGAKGVGVPGVGSYVTFDAAAGSQNIYALVEARSVYTPASGETFTLAAEVDRD